MKGFIEVETISGWKTLLNSNLITCVNPMTQGDIAITVITIGSGANTDEWRVKQNYDEVKRLLEESQQ